MEDKNTEKNISDLDLDPKVFSKFIYAFNIARHHSLTYPLGHPLIDQSISNFILLLHQLLEFRELVTLGVAKETLMLGEGVLDAKNAVYKDVATTLFSAGVAALTFKRSLELGELRHFLSFVNRKREELLLEGGLSPQLEKAGVRNIEVREIDYRPFHAKEVDTIGAQEKGLEGSDAEMLWINFVDELVAGSGGGSGGEGTGTTQDRTARQTNLDPAVVAGILNQRKDLLGKGREQEYDKSITAFMKQLDQEKRQKRSGSADCSKLSAIVSKLDPDVRRAFLNSTFRNLGDKQELARDVVGSLDRETLLSVLSDMEQSKISVPPLVLNLMGELAVHGGDPKKGRLVAGSKALDKDRFKPGMQKLFDGDHTGEFVPDFYQNMLQGALARKQRSHLHQELVKELTEALDGHLLEKQVRSIILDIVDKDPLCEEAETLKRNLVELIHYFLETGDFKALLETHERLVRHHRESDAFSVPLARESLEAFEEPEFIAGLLYGIDQWGKEHQNEIRTLMLHIGRPCVTALLGTLADEQNRVRRQFFMGVVTEMGTAARDEIIERLHDPRWYVVRNLVILLRGMNDPQVLRPLGTLVGHPHPRVQLEVMKTFLHYGDVRADRYLLKELEHSELQRRMNAVLLARQSRSSEVSARLLQMLEEGLSEAEFELKTSLIRSLGQMADPATLPRLEKFLHSHSLLHPILLRRLKIEVVRALGDFHCTESRRILTEMENSGTGELEQLAGRMLSRSPGEEP